MFFLLYLKVDFLHFIFLFLLLTSFKFKEDFIQYEFVSYNILQLSYTQYYSKSSMEKYKPFHLVHLFDFNLY